MSDTIYVAIHLIDEDIINLELYSNRKDALKYLFRLYKEEEYDTYTKERGEVFKKYLNEYDRFDVTRDDQYIILEKGCVK